MVGRVPHDKGLLHERDPKCLSELRRRSIGDFSRRFFPGRGRLQLHRTNDSTSPIPGWLSFRIPATITTRNTRRNMRRPLPASNGQARGWGGYRAVPSMSAREVYSRANGKSALSITSRPCSRTCPISPSGPFPMKTTPELGRCGPSSSGATFGRGCNRSWPHGPAHPPLMVTSTIRRTNRSRARSCNRDPRITLIPSPMGPTSCRA